MMDFKSILFKDGRPLPITDVPIYFRDLNLDQVTSEILGSYERYDLTSAFHHPLTTVEDVKYRQAITRDIDTPNLFRALKEFSKAMLNVHQSRDYAVKSEYVFEKTKSFLNSAESYVQAVRELLSQLEKATLKSEGLMMLRQYLNEYCQSAYFRKLESELTGLVSELDSIHYSVIIHNGNVTVKNTSEEIDYTPEIEETFAKFRQGSVKDYLTKYSDLSSSVNHIQKQVLDRVALLYPEPFQKLTDFQENYANFLDDTIMRLEREVQFFIAYFDYIGSLKDDGLKFCIPETSDNEKNILADKSFDLAMAKTISKSNSTIVTNDLHLSGIERVFVVSGPNQGGKTTFARMIGQLHHIAQLGLPVPGISAKLYLPDQIFTHFEKSENITNLRGKLEDDLVRIHEILENASPRSLVIMNEIFSSTTIKDATSLSRKVFEAISDLDLIAVFVTFIDELAEFNEKTVSMMTTVDLHDPSIRTFKVERKDPTGRAYAISIAEKYHLTRAQILERIPS
jgi:DNA mismatch repair protein MutS